MRTVTLDELSVSNLGLIESAVVEPGPGLVVITGETGTGKTLLLGALRLLRGEQAGKDLIGPDGDEVSVAGRFVFDDDEMVLARRVTAARSRAYRDGAMVPARALAEAAGEVVEIVGQHDHLALTERAGVRLLLDGGLDEDGGIALRRYRSAWDELQRLREREEALGGDRRSLERELDVVRFQADEITAAGFRSGDDADLEARAVRLRNVETLAEYLAKAMAAIGDEGATGRLSAASRELELAARTDPSMRPITDQLADVSSLLGDLVSDVAAAAEDMDRDPEALEEVEQRLALLADLRRKYGDDLDAVLDFAEGAVARATELEAMLGEAEQISAAVADAVRELSGAADDLTVARRSAATKIEAEAVAHLTEMGLPRPVLRFGFEPTEPAAGGADRITLLFASDDVLPPAPIAKSASGGELSRVVLALRLATGVGEAPVIAFDEIDAGVGGVTALAVGAKLAALAEGRQVLCVTHLPQVAAHAATHVVVTRDDERVTVRVVEGDDRIRELTRMLAGLAESSQGKRHAAELLALAGRRT